jgi:hypothetical protein
VESGYSIDQLENIAWATATSAAQSPLPATIAIRALRDLLTRWLLRGERDRADQDAQTLPVVYVDGVTRRIMDAFATLIVATAESRQAQTCAELASAFAHIAHRLESDEDRAAFDAALDSSLPAIIQHAELPRLQSALSELSTALERTGSDAERVNTVRELLTEATRRLLPKASDEPEAAHPRAS